MSEPSKKVADPEGFRFEPLPSGRVLAYFNREFKGYFDSEEDAKKKIIQGMEDDLLLARLYA